MGSINGIFETARRSLYAQQTAMDVTSHNIANAGTVGYTRQRPDFTATNPKNDPAGLLGTGVEVSTISRLRGTFVDTQLRNSKQNLGFSSSQSKILSQIEAIVNEPSDNSLQSMMQGFFKAWQTLTTSPEDMGARQLVVQASSTLSSGIRNMYQNMQQLKTDITDEVTAKVDKVNSLTKEISVLNNQILDAANNNRSANDLADKRDLKIDELSTLANIKTFEASNGVIRVTIGAVTVADEHSNIPLDVLKTGGALDIVIGGTTSSANISGGELGGLIQQNNVSIPSYLADLDTLSTSIKDTVNSYHSAGYGLKDNSGAAAQTGNDFFTSYAAGNLVINPDIIANPRLIAASGSGSSGDNTVASKIANSMDELTINGGTVSQRDFYKMLTGKLGVEAAQVKSDVDGQQLISNQLEAQRNSESSVSLDEEMSNMIKFQRSYDASAKLIKTIDEMMSSIINMV